jgi:hypothetical protein
MTNLMHKFLIYYLFTSSLHVLGFLLAHLQRQAFNIPGYGVGARAQTPYPGMLNHAEIVHLPLKVGQKKPQNMQGRSKWISKLKTYALCWSLYNFIPKRMVLYNIKFGSKIIYFSPKKQI